MVNYYLNKKINMMQLSELRKFVGWNTMESSLSNPKLQCFLSVSAFGFFSMLCGQMQLRDED